MTKGSGPNNEEPSQQRNKERYKLVRGGGWDRLKASFHPGDFVLLKQTKSTLDAPARPHVLRVVEIRLSGVAVLEGSDAPRIEEEIKNIAHNPLPILDNNTCLERLYRRPSMHRRVSGRCCATSATKYTNCGAWTSRC